MNKNYDKFEIFRENVSTLKETSLDNENGHKKYMTQSLLSVVDFDGVKEMYIKNMALPTTPRSNDALYINEKEEYFLLNLKMEK